MSPNYKRKKRRKKREREVFRVFWIAEPFAVKLDVFVLFENQGHNSVFESMKVFACRMSSEQLGHLQPCLMCLVHHCHVECDARRFPLLRPRGLTFTWWVMLQFMSKT